MAPKKSICYWVSLLVIALLVILLVFAINNWKPTEEFIPYRNSSSDRENTLSGKNAESQRGDRENTLSGKNAESQRGGSIQQYGGAPMSITQDPSLYLNPDGGQSVSAIMGINSIGKNAELDPSQLNCRWNSPTLCSLPQKDQKSLNIALQTSGCFNDRRCQKQNQTAGCGSCRPKEDWNYRTQVGSGISNNIVLFPNDPTNANQSELYNQFFRDAQNNLSEHSVDSHLYPAWSSLTSSYRNSPDYCGIGQTVDQQIPNDRCFTPNRSREMPDVINTQIKNYNRRLRAQVAYTPVSTVEEIIPYNGYLNEKPANFTSELTRTFDYFSHINLGH